MPGRREIIAAAGGIVLAGVPTGASYLGSSRDTETYEFIVSPDSEPSKYEAIADHLSEGLDTEVDVNQESTTEIQVQRLKTGAADFGETSTEVATTGHLREDFHVALNRRRFDRWCHDSVLLTRKNSDIEKITDLKERSDGKKRIAFGDRFSAPASIYPLAMLNDANVKIGDLPSESKGMEFIPYFGTYRDGNTAVDKLKEKEVHAAGVARLAVAEPDEEYPDYVRELGRRGGDPDDDTVDIPNSPIVISTEVSEEVENEFVDVFPEVVSRVTSGGDGADESNGGLWFDAARETSGELYANTVDKTSNEIDHSYKRTAYDELPEQLFPDEQQTDVTPTPLVTTDIGGPVPDITESTPGNITRE